MNNIKPIKEANFIIKGNPDYENKNTVSFYKELKRLLPGAIVLDSTKEGYRTFKDRVKNDSVVIGFSRGCPFGPYNKKETGINFKSIGIGCSGTYGKKLKKENDYLFYDYNLMNHSIINNIEDKTKDNNAERTEKEKLSHWKLTPDMITKLTELLQPVSKK